MLCTLWLKAKFLFTAGSFLFIVGDLIMAEPIELWKAADCCGSYRLVPASLLIFGKIKVSVAVLLVGTYFSSSFSSST